MTVTWSIENLGIRTIQVIDEFNRYLIWKPHLPKKFKKYSLLHQFRFSYAFIIFWHETDYSEYLFSGRKSDLVVTGTLIDFESIKALISSIPRNFNLKFFSNLLLFLKVKNFAASFNLKLVLRICSEWIAILMVPIWKVNSPETIVPSVDIRCLNGCQSTLNKGRWGLGGNVRCRILSAFLWS